MHFYYHTKSMKRLFLLPLFLLFLLMTATPILAATSSSSAQPTPSQLVNVNYDLPYPGLLPDNPLYVLKVMRDGIVGFFISDPMEKSKFDLLQADKRLNAGVYLSQEQKVNEGLVVSTISKGENYFQEAIGQLSQAKMQGQSIGNQAGILETAAEKHVYVIHQVAASLSPSSQKALKGEAARAVAFEKMVKQTAQK
jgi:hypothetical protein